MKRTYFLKDTGESLHQKNDTIVDDRGARLAYLYGQNKEKLGNVMVRALNRSQIVEDLDGTIPTCSVFPRKDQEGFLGKPIIAEVTARIDEGSLRIVFTFNEEVDVIYEWENKNLNTPWDSRVVEAVALMDLSCIRCDMIWLELLDVEEKYEKIGEMLRQLGFKLQA